MPRHYGQAAYLYSTRRGIRGIRFGVDLPSGAVASGEAQQHFISAYAGVYLDVPTETNMIECGVEKVAPIGDKAGIGAKWRKFLNPVGGQLGDKAGQRELPLGRESGRVSFELMLESRDTASFKVDDVRLYSALASFKTNGRPLTEAEFDAGVNVRICLGYNDEGASTVAFTAMRIFVKQLYSNVTGTWRWGPPTGLAPKLLLKNAVVTGGGTDLVASYPKPNPLAAPPLPRSAMR